MNYHQIYARKAECEVKKRMVKMTYFEKYFQLKNDYADKDFGFLAQYLHIVQVMQIEERNYKKHRNELVSWLNNIEKSIKESREGD